MSTFVRFGVAELLLERHRVRNHFPCSRIVLVFAGHGDGEVDVDFVLFLVMFVAFLCS